jgi:hypothetical protein
MSKPLSRLLRREQLAFLSRDKAEWVDHLQRIRSFLGQGLQAADPSRPVLILGAGSGLEVPWDLAPKSTTGWDADPWSRAWTALRHHRWPPWVFEDLTGGLAALDAAARRAVAEPWSGHRRDRETAAKRLAGLLPFLGPEPLALRSWLMKHRPGTILAANVMGQFGVVAERVVEEAFGFIPWDTDPERTDVLAEAMDAWTRRAISTFLAELSECGADLWLVHDRAVVFSGGSLTLGPWDDDWPQQLGGEGAPIEASDALAGVDVCRTLQGAGLTPVARERWLWPVATGQRHLVEALSLHSIPPGP